MTFRQSINLIAPIVLLGATTVAAIAYHAAVANHNGDDEDESQTGAAATTTAQATTETQKVENDMKAVELRFPWEANFRNENILVSSQTADSIENPVVQPCRSTSTSDQDRELEFLATMTFANFPREPSCPCCK